MIISRTPFRISFAGGGSDVKEFYDQEPGAVVSATINKYMYLSMHPMFNSDGFHLKYFDNELVKNLEDIRHPIIKEVFKRFGIKGMDFNSSSDVPSGTGLGSSSSFTVGLINICTSKFSKDLLAEMACNIEIDTLKAPIGKQDQYAASFGGLNYIRFEGENVEIKKLRPTTLQEYLMLYYVGSPRKASGILSEHKKNIEINRPVLRKMVKLAESLLEEIDSDNLGEILHTGWMYKKELGNVTNEVVDYWYDLALKNGAEGGKLLGAGHGGFLLLFTKDKARLRAKMGLYELPFKFEDSGTKIIYNQ